MKLYHYSNDGTIEVFEPRPPKNHPSARPAVWAIDELHSPLYFYPRECPRVAWWRLPNSDSEDIKQFLPSGKPWHMAIAPEWEAAWRAGSLYRYELSCDTFFDREDHGCHVSYEPVRPIHVIKLTDLPDLVPSDRIAIEIRNDLAELVPKLLASTLHCSAIRMRNLKDWPHATGKPTFPPD